MGLLYTNKGVEQDAWFTETLQHFLERLTSNFPSLVEEDLEAILHGEMLKRIDDTTFYDADMLMGVFEESLEAAAKKVQAQLS